MHIRTFHIKEAMKWRRKKRAAYRKELKKIVDGCGLDRIRKSTRKLGYYLGD